MPRPKRRRSISAALCALALTWAWVGAACTSHAGPAAAPAGGCAPPRSERLDPQSVRHLFPGAPEPRYLTDPPTSGPHQLGPPDRGVVTAPITRPKQVAMLEAGFVIVQYRDLSATEVATLAGLAGNLVTVAPAVGPLPGPVVATAWTWKLVCRSVAPGTISAIGSFVAAHRGVGFDPGPTTGQATSVPSAGG